MKLHLYLSLIDGANPSWQAINGELWVREVETSFVPTPGVHDAVLWSTEEEGPDGGPMWSIKRTFMLANGEWAAEFSHMLIDPTDAVRDVVSRHSFTNLSVPERWRFWSTNADGDPRVSMRAGGWRAYEKLVDDSHANASATGPIQ